MTLHAWKFIAPVVDDPADVVRVGDMCFEGYAVIVLAENIDEARAVAKTAEVDSPDDLLWIDVVTPERIPLTKARVLAWLQLA